MPPKQEKHTSVLCVRMDGDRSDAPSGLLSGLLSGLVGAVVADVDSN
jgi:hypothetical protein